MTDLTKKTKRRLQATVIGGKMEKTKVVAVVRLKKHPKYAKYYRITKKLKVHDEKNEYQPGDRVEIEETRPLSKEKRWIITAKL